MPNSVTILNDTGEETFVGEISEKKIKEWLKQKNVYYLNIKGKTAILHNTDCSHLGEGFEGNNAKNSKVCANSSQALENWAKDKPLNLKKCLDCM